MKATIITGIVVAVFLALTSMYSDADQHKGRGAQDRAQDQSQAEYQKKEYARHKEYKQSQDQLQLKDEDIYGHKLMSPEELHQYRERLRAIKTEEERNRFEAQHREEMQIRAKALQIELEDAD